MTSGTTQDFRFRDILLVAYGPSVVSAIGHGAMLPVLALRARDLGADVSLAAAIVALLGVGQLLASLPAGALVRADRRAAGAGGRGPRRRLRDGLRGADRLGPGTGGRGAAQRGVLDVVPHRPAGFMIDVVPESHRARAMSLLGGSYRVGVLIGPLIGAGLIAVSDLTSVFWLGAAMSVLASLLAGTMPDLGEEKRAAARATGHLGVWTVDRRAPPGAGHAGHGGGDPRGEPLAAAQPPAAVGRPRRAVGVHDVPHLRRRRRPRRGVHVAGRLADGRRGRMVVAVPVVLSMAVACLLLPLATDAVSVALVMALIACGNGLGSGIVMTLGADAAPADGRSQFLGAWRLCGDIGNTGGPLLVSAVAAVAPLAVACVTVGVLGLVGAGWVGHWTRRVDQDRAALSRR